jgi:hypothetical protein
MVAELSETLKLSRSMLAALLGITESSLDNIVEQDPYKVQRFTKFGKRILHVYTVMVVAQNSGVPDDEILNLLDEPFQPDREDSDCLLTMIVSDRFTVARNYELVQALATDYAAKLKF